MRTLKRTIRLYRQQASFTDSDALFRAFVGGRSAGKSTVGCYDLLTRALPGRTYTVADPTSVMSRDDTYPRFQKMARELGLWGSVKLTPYPDVTLTSGAVVRFRTADDPDRMRGPDVAGYWLNEASLMSRDAFLIAIGCLRQEGQQGWLSSTFTPSGPTHWTFEEFATGKPNTALFRAPTRANPFNPPGFAATLAGQYGDGPWARQELEGLFVQAEGAVFPAEWFADVLVPAWPDGVTHNVLYLDPSEGKSASTNDAQAFVRAGFYPGPKHENLIYLDCVSVKEPPPDLVARAVRMVRDRWTNLLSFEINGTMGFLEAEMRRQFAEAQILVRLWPVRHTSTEGKRERIKQTLMPYLSQHRVRIIESPGGRLLKAQLQDEPFSAHDDCADACAGAITELEQLVLGGV